ncbi:unnamed protein product [Rotaria sp. Silwood2]|nr:unnamed protein product [Rotaria sp. Silwood2]CAF4337487.1 unnamed protein product [Rotaria sp. Silwood2]
MFILVNQRLWIKQNNKPETPYEFRLAQVNRKDGLSLYSSVLNGSDRVDFISPEILHENVASHILQSKDINVDHVSSEVQCKTREEYWDKIKQCTTLGGSTELNTLACLYPKHLFCVISRIECEYAKVVVNVCKYVENILSYKKCIFIYYDGISGHYSPLYLYNKTSEEEEKSNFKYDDDTMKILLFKFIQQDLKYDDYIDFEETKIVDQPAIISNEKSDNISDSIANNDMMDTEQTLENNENPSMSNTIKIFPSSTSNINADDLILTVTSNITSETTQEFFRKSVPADGDCLFSSLSNVLDTSGKITTANLREKAADFISQPDKIDVLCLLYETGKPRDQYCSTIKNTKAWGGHPEIEAIAESYEIRIRVVDVHTQQSRISISEFPSKKTSFEQCCYIIRQNSHYESLHLRIDNNSKGERAIFNSNDKKVKELICDFIGKEFPNYKLESCNNQTNVDELSVQPVEQSFDKLPDPTNLISINDTTNVLKKRKLSNVNNNLPSNIDELFQTNFSRIKLKIEPAEQFRARALSDYIPKKEYKRDGKTRAERRCPTYFADRVAENNKHKKKFLTLLIPTTLVFGKNPIDLNRVAVEICIVTRTIDGCIYIHPYYKFYKPENDGEYFLSNPMFICLGYDKGYENLIDSKGDLIEIMGILNMNLYLTVIHILNSQLETLEKPIEPFESKNSNGIADTKIYNKSDVLKNKFHLNDLRFAITLWMKKDGEETYSRRVDLQYISEISTGQSQQTLNDNQ